MVEAKNYLIITGVAYPVIIISKAAYFPWEVIAFMNISVDVSKTDELIGRVNFWYRSPMVRNVLQFLALILTIIATYKKMMS
ncbi:hypothetical protein [Galbibacter pacificus]|uniref:Uncharacterized protein n=1 Tax=Galbibacter pacificus TaxID=2996052 RepID=A0ABT6FQY9_9FLAO|nr:hypothetical protein [Galbibacter pacificus]MDG3581846.1 hypothetical protein [Galbibacter pacificus]MDG3585680.1 hypothetical protein [Galbibacter pacificus]